MKFETGLIKDKYPFVLFGKGSEKLVIFPPLDDALYDSASIGWHLTHYFRDLHRHFKIMVISRRKNLPLGYTAHDMAADYAEAFETIGPANLMGISLGGMIAQHFAARYPQYVKRLVLVSTSHTMGVEGLEIGRRWIPWARAREWSKLYMDMVAMTYRGLRRKFYELCAPVAKLLFLDKIQYPSDFIISGQAAMIHDSSADLPNIKAPTLIVSGSEDPFFPQGSVHEMAEKIENSRLIILPGGLHGAYEYGGAKTRQAVIHFLENRSEKTGGRRGIVIPGLSRSGA